MSFYDSCLVFDIVRGAIVLNVAALALTDLQMLYNTYIVKIHHILTADCCVNHEIHFEARRRRALDPKVHSGAGIRLLYPF